MEGYLRDNPQDDLPGNLPDCVGVCLLGCNPGYGRSEDFSSNFHVGDVKASPFTAPIPPA